MAKKHRALVLFLSLALFLSYQATGAAPASTQTGRCSPDVNLDGEINLFDLVVISRFYGSYVRPGSQEDTNSDGKVDIFDLVCISINMRPCNCVSKQYDCPDFPSQAAAQACYEYCWRILGYDVHSLDSDADGTACEYDFGSTPVQPTIPTATPTLTSTPTRQAPPTPTPTRTATGVPPSPTPTRTPTGLTEAQVTEIVDGDTIWVRIGGNSYKVRYIGMDTPETRDPDEPVGAFGPEACAKNAELVRGRTVYLEKDVRDVDQYGRLLRYVWVGTSMVNAELVRLGYAQVSTVPPDVKYVDLFLRLEREARQARSGLWGAPLPWYMNCNCAAELYDCQHFESREQAQACYEHCKQVVGYDVHHLDEDNDGQACVRLARCGE